MGEFITWVDVIKLVVLLVAAGLAYNLAKTL